jgi:twitching motility protein PilI
MGGMEGMKDSESQNTLNPFEVLLDYERRSIAHVPGMPEQLEAPGLWRGIAFRLGDAYLLGGIADVTEILRFPALTTVPGTKAWMLGIANVRGNLIPIVDLRALLEGESERMTERSRVLITRVQTSMVGLLVSEVLGQRSFLEENLLGVEAYADSPISRFLSGEVEIDGRRWGVFSMNELCRSAEFMQAAA